MTADPSFSEILSAASTGWCQRNWNEGVLSLALPLQRVDPLSQLHLLAEKENFRFLWDSSPGLSFAAAGQCQQLDLEGPRRFELAQKFSDATFTRLIDTTPQVPQIARPRILLAFSFFENTAERQRELYIPTATAPAVQSILPRWQLSRQGRHGWLRLNGISTDQADARELAEQLWLMREKLNKHCPTKQSQSNQKINGTPRSKPWEEIYKPVLNRGLDLVNTSQLHKLVLAVRQSIHLEKPLNPITLLSRLRQEQPGTCRFLWQNNKEGAFFGASPERLLSLRGGRLHSDALAGTTNNDINAHDLLLSDKDLREHELVVASITTQLRQLGLNPRRTIRPQLARYGHLVHLHTSIKAKTKGQLLLQIAEALHPTPAVAGLPRRDAMNWLRTLEPFERGRYAAPIGWIDNCGDGELRVAIRCGNTHGKLLELTAGAGLVKGSIPEKELEEVRLKLAVLANQLELQSKIY